MIWYNKKRMDGAIMNGKLLKVKQNNLEFGGHDRYVNILGCFKYKTTSNVYIVYSDTDTKYNIIYYGSGHIRQGVALCMACREKSEEEIIKEYIFKITQKESIDNFEVLSLEELEEIEIIDSGKIEVKPEILTELIKIVMPKPEIKEKQKDQSKQKTKKKRTPLKGIIIGLLIVGLLFGGYQVIQNLSSKDNIQKSITCSTSYLQEDLNATIEETNKYNFDANDKLKSINTTSVYKFNEKDYQNFILKGIYYKYMPSSNEEGSWNKNDEEYTFQVTTKKKIDTSYNEPTNYEEVLSYYKTKGHVCTEEIEKW